MDLLKFNIKFTPTYTVKFRCLGVKKLYSCISIFFPPKDLDMFGIMIPFGSVVIILALNYSVYCHF